MVLARGMTWDEATWGGGADILSLKQFPPVLVSAQCVTHFASKDMNGLVAPPGFACRLRCCAWKINCHHMSPQGWNYPWDLGAFQHVVQDCCCPCLKRSLIFWVEHRPFERIGGVIASQHKHAILAVKAGSRVHYANVCSHLHQLVRA